MTRMIAFIIILIAAFLPPVSEALSANQINICTQAAYTDAVQWKLTGSGRTLATSGCALFSYAHAIQYFRCPDALQRIESGAFANCRNLQVVYIPETVTYIAADAFTISSPILWSSSEYVRAYAQAHALALFDRGDQ